MSAAGGQTTGATGGRRLAGPPCSRAAGAAAGGGVGRRPMPWVWPNGLLPGRGAPGLGATGPGARARAALALGGSGTTGTASGIGGRGRGLLLGDRGSRLLAVRCRRCDRCRSGGLLDRRHRLRCRCGLDGRTCRAGARARRDRSTGGRRRRSLGRGRRGFAGDRTGGLDRGRLLRRCLLLHGGRRSTLGRRLAGRLLLRCGAELRAVGVVEPLLDGGLDRRRRRLHELAHLLELGQDDLALHAELFRELVDSDLSHASPSGPSHGWAGPLAGVHAHREVLIECS